MTFFAVLFALLAEQLKPLPRVTRLRAAVAGWADWAARNLDAGRPHHTAVVWCVAVVAPALLTALVYLGLRHQSLLLALAFDVVVLYFTLGFRQFTHYVTDIRDALDRGDELEARRLLAQWRQIDAAELPRSELLRQVIEHALLAAHRYVLGVFFWFVVLSALGLGPAGAVLYRLAAFAARHWQPRREEPGTLVNARLAEISRRWFARIDHVPARLTAVGFAIVGSFEEDVNSWRRDAGLWDDRNEGTVLASAAGAMRVQLGVPLSDTGAPPPPPAVDVPGIDDLEPPSPAPDARAVHLPQGAHLQSMVGLVWRSVALWMLLVALLTLANVLG